jgi:hypothetical protein
MINQVLHECMNEMIWIYGRTELVKEPQENQMSKNRVKNTEPSKIFFPRAFIAHRRKTSLCEESGGREKSGKRQKEMMTL